ncbi:MAG: hypothetical protein NT169_24330 [Chloroflexi bacterium]|nr:hypothetical protein [Chloroflexota bacterium]
MGLLTWQAALLGLGLAVLAILLTIWWRQQTFRWVIVLLVCLVAAPLLSWWSGMAFEVADYRAGCDGLCPGYRGAPAPFIQGEAAGGELLPGLFLVNCLVYLALLLGWSAVMRAILKNLRAGSRNQLWWQLIGGLILLVGPFVLSPLYLPPPEAHVRGDSQRIAINAQREVYLYDEQASAPILRVSLADVRPRRDGQIGMRVCLRLYTFFYLPNGFMVLDMTPEGVHSNNGGVLPLDRSCWD